jgi:hypothetical protein
MRLRAVRLFGSGTEAVPRGVSSTLLRVSGLSWPYPFTGTDETTMWRWLRENDMLFDTNPTRDIHAGARNLREWLVHRKGQ